MPDSINYEGILYTALASAPAILAILWSLFQHNKRIEDIRDTLRAEIKSSKDETLLKMGDLSEQNKISLTKLSSLEEDLKRTLLNIDDLNRQSKDFIRELTESKIKLEALRLAEIEQKSNFKELNENLSILKKSTSDNKDSLDSLIKSFSERLNEIEKYYVEKLTELKEQIKKKK